ncbi:hypothetical protein [Nitrosopumilus sp. Nsub]|uniref:hypothetical protein n=1 Tax=Nitrosopumilus sp. Nsub TaxID=1776294 RepID=UPI0012E3A8F9|nr:hypothetical protein [Nitrosopumilus sp. Nsub]
MKLDIDSLYIDELCNIFPKTVVDNITKSAKRQGLEIHNVTTEPQMISDFLHDIIGTGADFVEMQIMYSIARKLGLDSSQYSSLSEMMMLVVR